ncbi:TPA: CTP-dependent riboflavin kinase [Candidatus Micrarchaeota archaeon]|nr:CTP-dependent riboflavin kinase [Candidatus Micrarchaeota archaeon]HIH29964.1 CTP-dependent riboflavin kinase [Candidatus Micrarchaeota archaeon]
MLSEIVFFLLRQGAHREPKRITTNEVAQNISVSQQTASRKLINLEKSGEIERAGGKVFLTEKAVSQARRCVKEVMEALEGTSIGFAGTVVQGVGEGAYYLSQKEYVREFRKRLGFKPFPGTLNVSIEDDDIEKRLLLRQQKPIQISGFRKGNRTFGKIEAYRCAIGGIPAAIVFPERSVHGLKLLEIISPFQLRKKLDLSDGSKVGIEVVAN